MEEESGSMVGEEVALWQEDWSINEGEEGLNVCERWLTRGGELVQLFV